MNPLRSILEGLCDAGKLAKHQAIAGNPQILDQAEKALTAYVEERCRYARIEAIASYKKVLKLQKEQQ